MNKLFLTVKPKTLCRLKEARSKDYILYEPIYMKWPEKANLQRKTDCLGLGMGTGLTKNGQNDYFWSGGNILKTGLWR